MHMIKKIVFWMLLISFLIGMFFFIQLQRKFYQAILATQAGVVDTVNFIKMEFPNQVADYQNKIKEAQDNADLSTKNNQPQGQTK